MTIEQELAEVKEQLAIAESERDKAREQAKRNFANAKEAKEAADQESKTQQDEITRLKADNAKLTGERDALQVKVEKFDETLAAEANKQMQAALAKHGHPPLNLDGVADAPAAKAKPDFSKLTGLEKAIAAHKYEASATK